MESMFSEVAVVTGEVGSGLVPGLKGYGVSSRLPIKIKNKNKNGHLADVEEMWKRKQVNMTVRSQRQHVHCIFYRTIHSVCYLKVSVLHIIGKWNKQNVRL